jgi:NCAIR mutase (PurE)-related protein
VKPEQIRTLLAAVKDGATSIDDALRELRDLPFRALGFANADTHRHVRTGFPEVIFGTGKSTAQIATLLRELGRDGATVMATRIPAEVAKDVLAAVPEARYIESARIVAYGPAPAPTRGRGTIAVLTAGTADIPVAEEAAVAGLHRLLAHRETVETAEVLVVVAGMDGVLPTVVAGLFSRPVIAVPTSVGYGASMAGLSALLTMLNSCATGVAVVNIDNGFGAGRMASLMNRARVA